MGNATRLTTEPDPTAANVKGTPAPGDHSHRIQNFRKTGEPVMHPGVFVSPALNRPGHNQTGKQHKVENRKGTKR